ncbi:MAG: hypothetical protein DRP70_01450 [Spirochaetes bacterium]|nr:MAG: hypothetical protein DRP70_01450 [Spirochaetota bacterium]
MRIALFHYHLKPGGVTDVIIYSIRALLSRMGKLDEIRLVTGNKENTEIVLETVRAGFNRQVADKVRLDVLEEIGYTEEGHSPDPDQLKARLLARYDEDTLWWVHNYHLGKNPEFTAALMSIANSGSRKMLFHIHDFPECGRPGNLKRLNSVLKHPPYPSGSGIRYAVINERDRRILSDAGMEESVSLLTNPVPLLPNAPGNPEGMRKALEELCAKDNPGYIPGAPILLYPVRAIRRKNIIEAAILAKLLDEPANLIVTLPGVSAQEKEYSRIVESAFKSGLIPGIWCPEATGDERLSYRQLASSCDAVISTSVQEGFGYLFINALHWQKPLLARYLDILDGILNLFGDYPRRFWADFRIPATEELKIKTQEAYQEKIRNMEPNLSDKAIKSMNSAVSKIAAGGGIDISYLKVEDQLDALKLAGNNPEWLVKAKLLNRELLDSAGRTLKARAPQMDRTIEAHFGEASFVRNFNEILSSFGTKTPSPSPDKVRESVEKSFGRIDYLRLLYDD